MSSDLVAKLILQASGIVAKSRLDAHHPDNYGSLIITDESGMHEVSLEEVGSRHGDFNICFKVTRPVDALEDLENALVIDGPFGMLECTEVLFLDERSGELCRRSDAILVTSQYGQTLIQIDLNAVGTFLVRKV